MTKSIDDIRNVLVAGAGTLGLRIALRCALDGYRVTLFDINEQQLQFSRSRQDHLIRWLRKTDKISAEQVVQASNNLSTTYDIETATKDVDLVSESVIENIDIKKAFYQDLTPRLAPGTIVTTNTSFLLPSDIVEAVQEPANFCALHFHDVFNQLVVDVMPHPETDQAVIDLLMEFGRRINQIPVYVQKENEGYLFNTILMAIFTQAGDLLVNGIGSIRDVDRSFMGNFGLPIGPFGMLDQVGLDTAWNITVVRDDERSQRLAKMLKSYIDQGKLGHKSGEGFYTYPHPEYSQPDFLKS